MAYEQKDNSGSEEPTMIDPQDLKAWEESELRALQGETERLADQLPMDEDESERPCPLCGGTGIDFMESFMPCEMCDGEGYQFWLA